MVELYGNTMEKGKWEIFSYIDIVADSFRISVCYQFRLLPSPDSVSVSPCSSVAGAFSLIMFFLRKTIPAVCCSISAIAYTHIFQHTWREERYNVRQNRICMIKL